MIRAIVAEDQDDYAAVLQSHLEATGAVTVVARAATGLECLRLWEKHTPDLLVLDVQMPGLGGIEVAEIALAGPSAPVVVFVTAHGEFALRAYELHACDYIVKPSDIGLLAGRVADMVEHVARSLGRRAQATAEQRRRVSEASAGLEALAPSHPASTLGRLPVKDYRAGTVRLLATREITHARRDGKRVVIATPDEELPTYYTIDRLETRLTREGFIRVSAGALVNVRWIDHLVPLGDGAYEVLLRDRARTVLSASRPRAQALLRELGV